MNSKSLLFNIDLSTGVEPAEGRLLVAEPFLREDYFNHAVILLIDYGHGTSAMGTVLNNPTDYTLDELIEGVHTERQVPVYCGGPVAGDRLYFIHTLGDIVPETRPVAPGLYVGGDFQTILSIVNDGYDLDGHIRFFVGYSGWSPGQLDEEIAKNVWAVARVQAPQSLLRTSGDTMWHNQVRHMGPSFKGWLYHPRNITAN